MASQMLLPAKLKKKSLKLKIRKMTAKSELNSCFRRIIILSNYRERCEEELRQRLVNREKFDEAVFEEALAKAKKYDIVNDERYAELYAFCKTQCAKGVEGVKRQLTMMKIDYESMPAVMDTLNEASAKEYQVAYGFLERHPSSSKNQFESLVNKLVNRGFSAGLSIKVVKDLLASQQ